MPIIGYKKKFKNLNSLDDDIYVINFKVKYTETGSLKIGDSENEYFDVGDYNVLLDDVFDNFTKNIFDEYYNGIYTLSILKYIVDKVPNLYSINYESKNMVDIYYKEEIINDYNKIKDNNDLR